MAIFQRVFFSAGHSKKDGAAVNDFSNENQTRGENI